MSLTEGMGEYWGSILTRSGSGLGWLKRVIQKIVEKIKEEIHTLKKALLVCYYWHHVPNTHIYGDIYYVFNYRECVYATITYKFVEILYGITSIIGISSFRETMEVTASMITKFAETHNISAVIMTKFSETIPIMADIYNIFIQKIGIKGKTKSLEEMLLKELEDEKRENREAEENALLKRLEKEKED